MASGVVVRRDQAGEGVVDVVLDWPETRNAVGPDEADQLGAALAEAASGDARCVVVRSEGRAFCAGGNLRSVLALVEVGEEALRERLYASFQGLFRALHEVPVPVLAAVSGPAIGLGLDLVLACDMRYFGLGAWVRQGWSSLGLIPATGGLAYARRVGGPDAAWHLLSAGDRRIQPSELAAWGVGSSVPDADAEARRAACALAAAPRDRIVATKALVREVDQAAHLRAALDHQVTFLLDPSFREAARRALGENGS